MSLVKWEPLRDLEDLLDRYSRNLSLPLVRSGEWGGNGELCPRVDISENDNEFQIYAELPGVEKKDVKVKIENGVLVLEGERRKNMEEKGWHYHRIERSFGNFMRSFTLPSNVDADQLKAHFQDGLLELDLPKVSSSQTTAVEVAID